MTSLVLPAVDDLNVMVTVPDVLSGLVTLLARLSWTGKFSVEVGGLDTGSRVTDTKPAVCWFVTVTLPVIATAFAGIPPTPVILTVLGVPETNLPVLRE